MVIPARPPFFLPFAFAFAAAHVLALKFFLYWVLPWFDIVMHAWGGFLTIMGFMMLGTIGSRRLRMRPVFLPLCLVGVMVLWEAFEYYFGIAGSHPSYVADTALDFAAGAGGGLLALLLVRHE